MAFPASQSTSSAELALFGSGVSSVDLANSLRTTGSLSGGGGVPTSAAGTPLGLSLVHKWPQGSVEVSWAAGGAAGRVKILGRVGGGRVGGVRGKVRGFTGRSRLRMLEQVNSIKRSSVGAVWFLTLTVPSQDECTWQKLEQHRRAWFKRLRREWGGDWFAVWKKEPHKSGLPHLHVLLFWCRAEVPELAAFRRWNDSAWANVVQSVNPFHEKCGARVERMRGWNGVAWYCAKYCAKLSEAMDSAETGRIWGIENRGRMVVERVARVLANRPGRQVHRTLRKLQQRRRERWLLFDRERGCWSSLAHGWIRLSEKSSTRVFVNASVQADRLRALGFKVKKWTPKCAITRTVKVWVEVDDRGRLSIERGDDEKHTYLGGLQLIDSETIQRVTEHFEREWLDDPPF